MRNRLASSGLPLPPPPPPPKKSGKIKTALLVVSLIAIVIIAIFALFYLNILRWPFNQQGGTRITDYRGVTEKVIDKVGSALSGILVLSQYLP